MMGKQEIKPLLTHTPLVNRINQKAAKNKKQINKKIALNKYTKNDMVLPKDRHKKNKIEEKYSVPFPLAEMFEASNHIQL